MGHISSLDNPASWLSGDQQVISEEGQRREVWKDPSKNTLSASVKVCMHVHIYLYTHIDFPFEEHITHYLQPLGSVKAWVTLHPPHCLLLTSGCHHHHTKLPAPPAVFGGQHCPSSRSKRLSSSQAAHSSNPRLHTEQLQLCA